MNDEESNGCAGALALLLVVPACLLKGKVASDLWAWFAVPQFHVKPIPFGVAAGLMLLIGLVLPSRKPSKWNTSDVITYLFLVPLVVWAIGWIIWRYTV